MSNLPRRFRRGETSPERPGLLFFRYNRGSEMWLTKGKFEEQIEAKKIVQAKRRSKPVHKKKMRDYFREYNKRPRQKAYQAAYYSSPEVRARLRKEYAEDPQRLIEAQERERKKAQSEIRKLSPEYLARERQVAKKRYEKNKPEIFAKIVERRRNDPAMRVKQNISRSIRKAMRRTTTRKNARTHEFLGCTIPGFMGYLEKQFLPGMSWDNYGQWQIDHIIPVSRFPMDEPVAVRHAYNYRNCRPEWRVPNMIKGDKLDMALVAKYELWEWLPYVTDELREVA